MKKAMVLQDIKNTSTEPDPPAPSRKRNVRKAASTDKPQDLDTSVSGDTANLNLPLLQRVTMALEQQKCDTDGDLETDKDPENSATENKETLEVQDTNTEASSNIIVVPKEDVLVAGAKDAEIESIAHDAGLDDVDNVQTLSLLEHTAGNATLDQGFCNMSSIDPSGMDSQLSFTTDAASVLCPEQGQDIGATPEISTKGDTVGETDELSICETSMLKSQDVLQVVENSKDDAPKNDEAKQEPSKRESPTPRVCALSSFDEMDFSGTTSSSNISDTKDSSAGPKTDKRHVGSTPSTSKVSNTETGSTPKDILDDLDLEVGTFVGRRKSSRRRSQAVLSIPVIMEEPSPDVAQQSSQHEDKTPGTTPLCIINDGRRGRKKGRRKGLTPKAPGFASSEDTSSTSSESPEEVGRTVAPTNLSCDVVTPVIVCPITERGSRGRRHKGNTATPSPELIISSTKETPEVVQTAVVRQSESCVSRRRAPRSSPSVSPTAEVIVTQEDPVPSPIMAASVCIISDRSSRGRRKRSPPTVTPPCSTATYPEPSIDVTLSDTRSEMDAVSLTYAINDGPRGRHNKRRKQDGETPSPEVLQMRPNSLDIAQGSFIPTSPPVEEESSSSAEVTPSTTPQTTSPTPDTGFTAVKDAGSRKPDSGIIKRKSGKKRKNGSGSAEKTQATKKSPAAATSEITENLALSPLEENLPQNPEPSALDQPEPEPNQALFDDIDFGDSLPRIEKPSKQQKRRRKSADFDISNNPLPESPNIEDINWGETQMPSRRSRRLRRKSLDLYRVSISKAKEEEEEKRLQSVQRDSELEAEIQQIVGVSETGVTGEENDDSTSTESADSEPDNSAEVTAPPPDETTETTKPEPDSDVSQDREEENSAGETRRSRRTPKPVLAPQLAETSAEPKPKRAKKKKDEPSIEDIYLNKLWRTQMPKEKIWETIFEAPKSTKSGLEELMSKKSHKRHVNFDDFYNTNRLKRRRQKALKMGWKPMTEKKDMVAAANLEERLQTLDRDISAIEKRGLCIPILPGDVQPNIVSLRFDSTAEEGEEDFYTPVQSASNLLQFGQLGDEGAESSTGSLSPYQTFRTPMLDSAKSGFQDSAESSKSTHSVHLKVPKLRGLQPSDIIKQNWKRRSLETITIPVPPINLSAQSGMSTPNQDLSVESDQSGMSWADNMLSDEMAVKANNEMWDDTLEDEDDTDEDAPKIERRKDTPYLPKFLNSRLNTASTSYICGTSSSARPTQVPPRLDLHSTGRARKSLLADFPGSEPNIGSAPYRCSSCNCIEEKCGHLKFETDVSPINWLKPPEPNRGLSGNTTGDDEVFADGSLEVVHNQRLGIMDQDWGKRYSGEYCHVLPEGPVLQGTPTQADIQDPDMAAAEYVQNSHGEDTSNSMLDYVIRVSKERLQQLNNGQAPENVSKNETQDNSSYFVIDHLAANAAVKFDKSCEVYTTTNDESIPDIFSPAEKYGKMHTDGHEKIVVDTKCVDDFELAALSEDTKLDCQKSANTSDIELSKSRTIPLHYNKIIKVAAEDDLQCSEHFTEKDRDLEVLLEAFNKKDRESVSSEIIEASVSESEDCEPFKILKFGDAKNFAREISGDSECLSPEYGIDPKCVHQNLRGFDPKTCEKSVVAVESRTNQSKDICVALGYRTEVKPFYPEPSRAEKYIPEIIAEAKSDNSCLANSDQVAAIVKDVNSSFRPESLHYPETTVSFTDSSQNSTQESFNVESIIKEHLMSPEEQTETRDNGQNMVRRIGEKSEKYKTQTLVSDDQMRDSATKTHQYVCEVEERVAAYFVDDDEIVHTRYSDDNQKRLQGIEEKEQLKKGKSSLHIEPEMKEYRSPKQMRKNLSEKNNSTEEATECQYSKGECPENLDKEAPDDESSAYETSEEPSVPNTDICEEAHHSFQGPVGDLPNGVGDVTSLTKQGLSKKCDSPKTDDSSLLSVTKEAAHIESRSTDIVSLYSGREETISNQEYHSLESDKSLSEDDGPLSKSDQDQESQELAENFSSENDSSELEHSDHHKSKATPNDKVCIVNMEDKTLIMLDSPIISVARQKENRKFRQQQLDDYAYYHKNCPAESTKPVLISWANAAGESEVSKDSTSEGDANDAEDESQESTPVSECMIVDLDEQSADDESSGPSDNGTESDDDGSCADVMSENSEESSVEENTSEKTLESDEVFDVDESGSSEDIEEGCSEENCDDVMSKGIVHGSGEESDLAETAESDGSGSVDIDESSDEESCEDVVSQATDEANELTETAESDCSSSEDIDESGEESCEDVMSKGTEQSSCEGNDLTESAESDCSGSEEIEEGCSEKSCEDIVSQAIEFSNEANELTKADESSNDDCSGSSNDIEQAGTQDSSEDVMSLNIEESSAEENELENKLKSDEYGCDTNKSDLDVLESRTSHQDCDDSGDDAGLNTSGRNVSHESYDPQDDVYNLTILFPEDKDLDPPSPTSLYSSGDSESDQEEKLNLTTEEKRMLLLDSPTVSTNQQQDNREYRRQQVADYEYYMAGFEDEVAVGDEEGKEYEENEGNNKEDIYFRPRIGYSSASSTSFNGFPDQSIEERSQLSRALSFFSNTSSIKEVDEGDQTSIEPASSASDGSSIEEEQETNEENNEEDQSRENGSAFDSVDLSSDGDAVLSLPSKSLKSNADVSIDKENQLDNEQDPNLGNNDDTVSQDNDSALDSSDEEVILSKSIKSAQDVSVDEQYQLAPSELQNLLLDPPPIEASQLEANAWFREQQLVDYAYFGSEDIETDKSEGERERVVSWSRKMLQLILYDEDIWCDSLDTTVEYDSSNWEPEEIGA